MTIARATVSRVSLVTVSLCLLVLALPLGSVAEGPPSYEPPAGYVPPEVDLRIVGLMQDQRVELGSTHILRAEARDADGDEWGDRFDWFLDSEHVATGPEFEWTVTGPQGDQRVTMVASSGDASAWVHVDVMAGSVATEPPTWLGPVVKMVPLVAMAFWLALVYRHMAKRRGDRSG